MVLPLTPTQKRRQWVVRIAFFVVFSWNVICALQFIFVPEVFVSSYQLSGTEGAVALRGLGVAFLMWNATYPAFIWCPSRFSALGVVIIIQQIIGLIGETIILLSLPGGYTLLADSILRFIIFDGAGLVLMLVSSIAFFCLLSKQTSRS